MTPDILFIFILLTVTIFFFLSGKLRVDLTAILSLLVLAFAGYLHSDEVFSGFSSPAVITLISTFFIGVAFSETGLCDRIGDAVYKICGDKERSNILAIMLVSGAISAFISNIATVAILMPAVSGISKKTRITPARLFIPLSFAAVLGGTITMIGTASNILAAQVFAASSNNHFELFSFTPFGLPMFFIGTLFMVTFGSRLLPTGDMNDFHVQDDISDMYRLHERLFTIVIPENSPLKGQTLASLRFGSALGVSIIGIQRGSGYSFPNADDKITPGDVLVVRGKFDRFQMLLNIKSFAMEALEAQDLQRLLVERQLYHLRIQENSTCIGQKLRELDLLTKYNIVVIGIHRKERYITGNLSGRTINSDDVLCVLCNTHENNLLEQGELFHIVRDSEIDFDLVRERLFTLQVSPSSSLGGNSLKESRMEELLGVRVVSIFREGNTIFPLHASTLIQADDKLVISGEPFRVKTLAKLGNLEIKPNAPKRALETGGVGEVALTPRSELVDQTLTEIDFRAKYGLLVLALWREGTPIRSRLSRRPLKLGDALLLFGPKKQFGLIAKDPDFVLLSGADQSPRRENKIPFALFSLVLLIGLVAFHIQPVHVAAFSAAAFLVVTKTISMDQAYRQIEWRIIFLVACLLPMGIAMQRSGAAEYLANTVVSGVGSYGPYAILAALFILGSAMSQALDSGLAVILLIPIATHTAQALNLSPDPFVMGVTLSASVTFLTPFSHRAHLLVMGAGGYRNRDYFKVGLPLTLISTLLLLLLIPLVLQF